jgi:predicted nucleic acid-binding Zn ribbon protein
MPLYVYLCLDDGTEAEVKHGYDEDPAITCPSCGSVMVRKPQPFTVARAAGDVLFEKMDGKYREYRARKAGEDAMKRKKVYRRRRSSNRFNPPTGWL